jgi:hypothetical protein
MNSRCNNPNNPQYHDYGGRGIRVCDRWGGDNGFANFIADIGRRPSNKHSIERIDNDGNYEPDNCRWATRSEQQRNRRVNRLLTYNGHTMCVAELADHLGISHAVIRSRLAQGWTVEEIFAIPRHKHRRHVKNLQVDQTEH